ncbi:uncharacterized protein LOC143175216 isoform X2 [Nomia melanderi]|uniref:uncharacterized protein LOC143175216 isoform X2 n=1 Tax=Nomia melanderi TaxID=2448451 RepID=UPI003FCC6830
MTAPYSHSVTHRSPLATFAWPACLPLFLPVFPLPLTSSLALTCVTPSYRALDFLRTSCWQTRASGIERAPLYHLCLRFLVRYYFVRLANIYWPDTYLAGAKIESLRSRFQLAGRPCGFSGEEPPIGRGRSGRARRTSSRRIAGRQGAAARRPAWHPLFLSIENRARGKRQHSIHDLDVPNRSSGWSLPNTICPPGLEYLMALDHLFVRQEVPVLEAFTGFVTERKYNVVNIRGEPVFYVAEESGICARLCLGSYRSCEFRVMTGDTREVLRMVRPLRCDACCCCCCLQDFLYFDNTVHD